MAVFTSAAARAGTTVASCLLAGVLVVSALAVIESRAAGFLLLGAVAVAALIVLLVIKVQFLPAIALAIIVFVPDRITDFSTSPLVTPATIVLSVWILRRLLLRVMFDDRDSPLEVDAHGRVLVRNFALLLSVIMIPLVVIAPVKQFAVSWTFTFIVAVLGPLLVGQIQREAQAVRTALPWLGALAALYVLLQTVLQDNLIYTPLYEVLGKTDVQHWAVYRADGSLGHPLLAGMFFAIVLAFCLGRWLETQQRRYLVPALINGGAIVCTVSRGSYLAATAGVLVLLLAALVSGRLGGARLVAIVAGFVGAGYLALNTDTFVQRGLSVEALASVNSRNALPQITIDTANAYYWLGGGPASSFTVAAPFNFQGLPIENSYLQLIISIGAPGVLLFLAIMISSAVIALRNHNVSALAGLVAYAVAISGFAALDSRRNLLVLLGVLIMLCVTRRPTNLEPPTPAVDRAYARSVA